MSSPRSNCQELQIVQPEAIWTHHVLWGRRFEALPLRLLAEEMMDTLQPWAVLSVFLLLASSRQQLLWKPEVPNSPTWTLLHSSSFRRDGAGTRRCCGTLSTHDSDIANRER